MKKIYDIWPSPDVADNAYSQIVILYCGLANTVIDLDLREDMFDESYAFANLTIDLGDIFAYYTTAKILADCKMDVT
eukprot:9134532-Heterocapsa_arctica.AAC.1